MNRSRRSLKGYIKWDNYRNTQYALMIKYYPNFRKLEDYRWRINKLKKLYHKLILYYIEGDAGSILKEGKMKRHSANYLHLEPEIWWIEEMIIGLHTITEVACVLGRWDNRPIVEAPELSDVMKQHYIPTHPNWRDYIPDEELKMLKFEFM